MTLALRPAAAVLVVIEDRPVTLDPEGGRVVFRFRHDGPQRHPFQVLHGRDLRCKGCRYSADVAPMMLRLT